MNRSILCRAALVLLPAGLAACSSANVARTLGLERNSPDEFTVTTRAPLAMPNDYTLSRPVPGAARPQEQTTDQAAAADLAPALALNTRVGTDTPGQDALVALAGPAAPADIRAQLEKRDKRLNSNGGVVNTLKFWKSTPPAGQVLDPRREAARLLAASAGDAKAAGARTPLLSQ